MPSWPARMVWFWGILGTRTTAQLLETWKQLFTIYQSKCAYNTGILLPTAHATKVYIDDSVATVTKLDTCTVVWLTSNLSHGRLTMYIYSKRVVTMYIYIYEHMIRGLDPILYTPQLPLLAIQRRIIGSFNHPPGQ